MKNYISPSDLRSDSFKLAAKIYQDGFRPDFMVALWRGGSSIGCCVHEFLKYLDVHPDHISIRTSRYTGIDTTSQIVSVHNLGYLLEKLTPESKVAIVDDVYDSGLTFEAVINTLREKLGDNMPKDIRIATVHYKPTRNKTTKVPDYYITETDDWLVYPHELEGLTLEEVDEHFGVDIGDLIRSCQVNK